jgi:RimK family alpha-L-glutamate ligase
VQVVILSARTGWHTDELCRALDARGHSARLLPYEGLRARLGTERDTKADLSSDGVSILDADAVLARIIPSGSLEQIIFRVDVLHWIEERRVLVMNSPRAIERAVDKFYTTALLQEAGLPTPETIACESIDEAMAAIRSILTGGSDVIVKPIFGSMGHGLVRLSDPDVAFRVLRSLEQTRPVYYVQRAIDHGGCDIRVFIVGGRVIGAIERWAADGDWRTNVARGGTARPLTLPAEWESFAVAAAGAVGADYAGVDLLPSRDGTVFVLEVNAIPGWQGLQRATGVDVAGSIVEHLERRAAENTSDRAQPAHDDRQKSPRAGHLAAEFPA